jgi:serine/threonine protein kinase
MLQLAASKGCRYVMRLEGLALMAREDRRLMVGLVMPLGEETLAEQVRIHGRPDDIDLQALLFQVLLGVYELHFHGVLHKDLSPANFIHLNAESSMPFTHNLTQLMMIDLGASKLVEELEAGEPVTVVYTPGFKAPEIPDVDKEVRSSRKAGEHGCLVRLPGEGGHGACHWGQAALILWHLV